MNKPTQHNYSVTEYTLKSKPFATHPRDRFVLVIRKIENGHPVRVSNIRLGLELGLGKKIMPVQSFLNLPEKHTEKNGIRTHASSLMLFVFGDGDLYAQKMVVRQWESQ